MYKENHFQTKINQPRVFYELSIYFIFLRLNVRRLCSKNNRRHDISQSGILNEQFMKRAEKKQDVYQSIGEREEI